MQAGRLQQKVSFQEISTEDDTAGQLKNLWTEFAIKRASIEPINGRDFLAASGEHADITTRVRVRYDRDTKLVRPKNRVVSGDDTYEIVTVINPQSRNRQLVLLCRQLFS